ncbi:MAG: metal-dependent transcriptional regulator [Balneolaceae bacterium]
MSRSQSVEDYLKAIYKLQSSGQAKGVTNSRIADALEVANASVTNMIKRLAEMGLVEYQSYKGTMLTEAGEKIALEMIRHHRLLELYLAEMLGYSWDEVHEEAEKLEHHISEQFEDTISELLNNPRFDPHGDPIPTKDGKMPRMDTVPLTEAEMHQPYIVRRVKNQTPTVLRFLEKNRIIPGIRLEVASSAAGQPIQLSVENNKIELEQDIAKDILLIPES